MRAENGRLKTESGIRPPAYSVKITGDNEAEITLVENVVEKVNADNEEEHDTIYVYDSYTMLLPYREGIETDVSANLERWLFYAKQKEYKEKAEEVRNKRDKLLADVDWTQMTDTALSEEKKKAYKNYRQKLRDIPEQQGFPYNVEYPTKP